MVQPSVQAEKPPSPQESQHNSSNQSETILQHLLETLRDSDVFPRAGKDAASRFWPAYERVAQQHDEEFLDRHNNDMDVLLIFAGLFSAVNSAFIGQTQSTLSPNPSDTTNALLKLLINNIGNGTFPEQDTGLPNWTGPNSIDVWLQTLAYASLATSLLAAFGAVLAKQWLGHFKTSRFGRGALHERCIRRQQKLDGLENWHFVAIIATLPILLQLSLLFFGITIAGNIWIQQNTEGSVIIGIAACGVIFYFFTVAASLKSPDCPFQTPVSIAIQLAHQTLVVRPKYWRGLWHWLPYCLTTRHPSSPRHCSKTGGRQITRLFALLQPSLSRITRFLKQRSRGETKDMESAPYNLPSSEVLHMKFPRAESLEAPAIRWILETSTDTDIVTTAARMVPEVEWPPDCDISGIVLRLKRHFLACFDHTNQLIPMAQTRALACMKAIAHCCFEGNISSPFLDYDPGSIWFDNDNGIEKYEVPQDQGFLLISSVNTQRAGKLDIASIPYSDRIWIAHIVPYHLIRESYDAHWASFVIDFIGKSLHDPASPTCLVADCLLSAGLIIGLPINLQNLVKLDKSAYIKKLQDWLMRGILDVLLTNTPALFQDTTRGLSMALELLHPLSQYIVKHLVNESLVDNAMSINYLRLCFHLLQEKMDLNIRGTHKGVVTSQSIAATLQISLSYSFFKGNQVIWKYLSKVVHQSESVEWYRVTQSGWYTQTHFDLLVDYLVQLCRSSTNDTHQIGDVLVVLGHLQGLPSTPDKEHQYIEAVIHSMRPDMPAYVRHAALNAACMIQKELISLAQDDVSIREQFSQALSSAVLFHDHATQGEAKGQFDPNSFLYEERDLCYLRLLRTLTQDSAWHDHLQLNGHFHRCLAIADTLPRQAVDNSGSKGSVGQYAVHIMHIFAIVDAQAEVSESQFFGVVQAYPSWPLILQAWGFMFGARSSLRPFKYHWKLLSRAGIYEALSPLIRYAQRHWEEWDNREETADLIDLVNESLILLKNGNILEQEGLKDLVGKIVHKLESSSFADK